MSPIISGGLGRPFRFNIFKQGPFSSCPLFFLHLGCFCLDFTSFFRKAMIVVKDQVWSTIS